MLTEDRQALVTILTTAVPIETKLIQIEQVFTSYIEWLDTQVTPMAVHPWYEYTSTDTETVFHEGEVLIHIKRVWAFGHAVRILSLRHREDLPMKDWNFFLAMKTKYLGPDVYAVEVYPPLGAIRDSSFTYHLFELPFCVGFDACTDGGTLACVSV